MLLYIYGVIRLIHIGNVIELIFGADSGGYRE